MAHFLPQAAIFDLDGTLTDSMYVWDHIPEELVRRFGGHPRSRSVPHAAAR